MPNATIDRDELRKELADGALILIDVLPKEYYGECHVAGACNACVHEVTFLDQVKAITADKDAAIVVYGSSGRSRDAAVAAEKLAEAGYRNVRAFTGGLHEWRAAGLPVNEAPEQAVPAPTLRDGTYRADPAKSMLHWTGRNINGRHHGTIAVASGELTMSGGTPVTGQVVVDMTAIVDVDLADSALNRLLVAHLQSDDFFDTARRLSRPHRTPAGRRRHGPGMSRPGPDPLERQLRLRQVLRKTGDAPGQRPDQRGTPPGGILKKGGPWAALLSITPASRNSPFPGTGDTSGAYSAPLW